MGLLDDLLYGAPDNSGLLGYLNSGLGGGIAGVAPSAPPSPTPPIGVPRPGEPGAPSVPISPPGLIGSAPSASSPEPINAPATAPAFGAGATPFIFPQSQAFGAQLPAPTVSSTTRVPQAVANANAKALADDDEEDAPTAQAGSAPASPIRVGNQMMPRIGPASAFTPATPAPSIATPAQSAPPAQDATASPFDAIGNRLKASLQSFGNGGGLIGGTAALLTGERHDPVATFEAKQAQETNVTGRALLLKGVDPQLVALATQPGGGKIMQALLPVLSPEAYTQETDKDGNVWNKNRQTGQKTIALQAKDDKFQHFTVKEFGGAETPYTLNSKTGEAKRIDVGSGGGPGAPGFGSLLAQGVQYDPNKTGDAYMSQFSPEVQAAAKAYINGDVMPTGNARKDSIATFAKTVAQKYGQDTGTPVNDSTYAGKRKMQTDLASSSNSSMGGILSNGESSFSHLAEATSSMADLGNSSYNVPGGGIAAHVKNYVGNSLGGSDTQAKILATIDNLGKYGAESTKFYAGTGGGVEERTAARKDVDPNKVSGEEMASFAEKEKGLMLDRLNTKFQQIRDTFGEEEGNRIIAKHMPQIQKNIATIDANIAKLRGQDTRSPSSKPAVVTQNGHTYNLQPDGSYK